MPPKTNEDLIEEFFAKENDTAYSVDIAASGGDLNSKEYTRELLCLLYTSDAADEAYDV